MNLLQKILDQTKKTKENRELLLQPKFTINKGWFDLMMAVAKDYKLIENDDVMTLQTLLCGGVIDVRLMREILYEMVAETGNILLPTEVSKHITPFSFGTLSIVLWTSPNTQILMENISQYSIVLANPIRLHYHKTIMGDVEIWFHIIQPYNKQLNITSLGLMVMISSIIYMIRETSINNDFKIDVFTTESDIDDILMMDIKRKFNCNLHFNSMITKIRVSNINARNVLRDSNEDIYNTNMLLLRKQVSMISSGNIIICSYNILDEMPCLLELSNNILAKKMNMSVRTLNRRLYILGTNYRRLIEKYKLEKSIHLLHQRNISMTEISYQLGYSDLSTFSRAFKRWTGVSPSKMDL